MSTEKQNKLDLFVKAMKETADELKQKLNEAMEQAEKDTTLGDNLDTESLRSTKLYSKYLKLYTDESIKLSELMNARDSVKLERWKYYSGKQTSQYNMENGILHDKVLKSDIDKYLAADRKLNAIVEIVTIQKLLVDFYEKVCFDISKNRNFQLKIALDWRKFVSGA